MSFWSDAFNFISAPVNAVEKVLKKTPLAAPVRAGLAPFDLTKDILSGKNVFESTANRGLEGIANSSYYGNKLQTSIWDSKPGKKIFGETNALTFGTENRAQAVPRLLNQIGEGGGVQESGVKKYDELNAAGRGTTAVATAAAVYFGGAGAYAAGGGSVAAGIGGGLTAYNAAGAAVTKKSPAGLVGGITSAFGGSNGLAGDYGSFFSDFGEGFGQVKDLIKDNIHSSPSVSVNDPIGLSNGYGDLPQSESAQPTNMAAVIAIAALGFAAYKLVGARA